MLLDVAALFSSCLGNVHCAAILLGAVAYLIYTAVFSVRPFPPWSRGSKEEEEEEEEDEGSEASPPGAGGAAAHDAATAGDAAACGADGGAKRHGSSQRRHAALPAASLCGGAVGGSFVLVAGGIAFLLLAASLTRSAWSRHQQGVCAPWREGPDAVAAALWASTPSPPPAPQRHRPTTATAAAATALGRHYVPQRFAEFSICRNISAASTPAVCGPASPAAEQELSVLELPPVSTPEAERARQNHAKLLPLCEAVGVKLRELRRVPTPKTKWAVGLLVGLQRLEEPYRDLLEALRLGDSSGVALSGRGLEPETSGGSEGGGGLDGSSPSPATLLRQEFRALGASSCVCMLEALQEARLVAVALPRGDALVQQAISCEPSLLAELEAVVVGEAEQADDASVVFALGVYWSELGVAAGDAPLFGRGRRSGLGDVTGVAVTFAGGGGWADDETGKSSRRVPAVLARAEALLLRGEEAAEGPSRLDRRAIRALRLYQHAKSLALMHHDTAAEARYLLAAEVAASSQRQKLAAHSLTRLSYLLSLRGNHQRALDLARQALTYTNDPLATYLKATLRRRLGHLRSFKEITEVEEQVSTVTNKLPSQGLELQRAATQKELQLWRQAAAAGAGDSVATTLSSCLALGDVAHVMLCAVCWYLFEPSPAPAPETERVILGVKVSHQLHVEVKG